MRPFSWKIFGWMMHPNAKTEMFHKILIFFCFSSIFSSFIWNIRWYSFFTYSTCVFFCRAFVLLLNFRLVALTFILGHDHSMWTVSTQPNRNVNVLWVLLVSYYVFTFLFFAFFVFILVYCILIAVIAQLNPILWVFFGANRTQKIFSNENWNMRNVK